MEGPGDDMGGNPGELFIEADPISTTQVKGGVMYGLGDMFSFLNMIPVVGKVYDDVDIWFNFGLKSYISELVNSSIISFFIFFEFLA